MKTFAAWATLILTAALLPACLLALAITGGLR